MSYDLACYNLAESFLLDHFTSTKNDINELAQLIQTTIEDYCMKYDDDNTKIKIIQETLVKMEKVHKSRG